MITAYREILHVALFREYFSKWILFEGQDKRPLTSSLYILLSAIRKYIFLNFLPFSIAPISNRFQIPR